MPLSPQATQPIASMFPPPLSGVIDGSIPAIRFPAEKRNEASSPLSQFVAQNLDSIARAGAGFCELPDKQSVIFSAVKTSKAAILKAYHEKKLDSIAPEIKATPKPKTSLAPKHRTVHAAPVDMSAPVNPDAAGGQPPAGTAQAPTNSQNAPSGPQPGSAPHDPDSGPVKVNKKLMGARVSALRGEDVNGVKLPASVSDKLSKRAI